VRLGQTVVSVEQSVRDILKALASRLTFIDNFLSKVMGPIVTPGTANTEFTVQHNMGRVPIGYIWNVDQACTVYDSRRANWTDQQLFLKCSVVSANLYLVVF
jgi:hypothetical protein